MKQLTAKGGELQLPGGLSLEALLADVQLGQVKEATKAMMEALRALAAEHPELGVAQRLEAEAGVRLAGGASCDASSGSRPGSAARSMCGGGSTARVASAAGSRPGSGRCLTPSASSRMAAPASPSTRLAASTSGRPASSSSVRSVGSARGSPVKAPSVQTMQLQL